MRLWCQFPEMCDCDWIPAQLTFPNMSDGLCYFPVPLEKQGKDHLILVMICNQILQPASGSAGSAYALMKPNQLFTMSFPIS